MKDSSLRSILITGGTGFIGSHTCLKLLEKGYFLYVVDSFINSSPKVLRKLEELFPQGSEKFNQQFNLIEGDIRDSTVIENIFINSINQNRCIEAVIHFAGLKSVEESLLNPSLYWDINVGGSIALVKVLEKYNCRTIVFSSSATVYNSISDSPLSENCEVRPCNPYGETKATVENILRSLYKNKRKDWRVINLRYFNPIGAHSSGVIGEDPIRKTNNLFPYLSKVASGNKEVLKIFGNDWPTFDGTAIRDYIHIMDLADVHCLALEYLLQKEESRFLCLNVGTGKGTSILELLKTYEIVNSCKIPFIYVDRRPGDIAISFAKTELATSILNWKPKFDISDMCRDGWNWQKLNPCGYQ